MIADTINQKITEALRGRDEIRLSTLRLLSSALNYEKIAKQHVLSDEEEVVVVRREVKKRQEAIDAYEKVGAKDRAEQERKEIAILKEFLPAELSEEALVQVVEDAIAFTGAKSLSDFGKVMSETMRRVAGAADGERVSKIVTARLNKND